MKNANLSDRDIKGKNEVNTTQLNRILSWFPEKGKPRRKFDNCFDNYFIKYKYFKGIGKFEPEP